MNHNQCCYGLTAIFDSYCRACFKYVMNIKRAEGIPVFKGVPRINRKKECMDYKEIMK